MLKTVLIVEDEFLLGVPSVVASAYGRPELVGGDVLIGAPNVGKPTDEHRLLLALEQPLNSSV